jgi:hypothetical protein
MEARTLAEQVAGALCAVASMAAYAVALDRVRLRLRNAPEAWWASLLRDLVNLGGAAALSASLYLFGFPVELALLLSLSLALCVYSLDYAASRTMARPPRLVIPLAAGLLLPVLLLGSAIAPALARWLRQLFPDL